MKYKRNTPALIRDRLKMKDCIIRNLNRELDRIQSYKDEIEELDAKEALYNYAKSKGRISFPFSYDDR